MLRHMALDEQRAHIGVEAHSHQHDRHVEGLLAQHARFLRHGDGVQIDDTVKAVVTVLVLGPDPQRAEVAPEVGVARWLDAREHSGHGARVAGRPFADGGQ